MFIQNKSDELQRIFVNQKKQDIRPWEIVDITEEDNKYVKERYDDKFWEIKIEQKEEWNKRTRKLKI